MLCWNLRMRSVIFSIYIYFCILYQFLSIVDLSKFPSTMFMMITVHSAVKSKYLPVKKIKSPMCQYIGWNSLHNKNFTIKIAYLLLNVKRYQFKL